MKTDDYTNSLKQLKWEILRLNILMILLKIFTALVYTITAMLTILLVASLLAKIVPLALSFISVLGPVIGAFMASPVFLPVACLFITLTLLNCVMNGKNNYKSQRSCANLLGGCWQRNLNSKKDDLLQHYHTELQNNINLLNNPHNCSNPHAACTYVFMMLLELKKAAKGGADKNLYKQINYTIDACLRIYSNLPKTPNNNQNFERLETKLKKILTHENLGKVSPPQTNNSWGYIDSNTWNMSPTLYSTSP